MDEELLKEEKVKTAGTVKTAAADYDYEYAMQTLKEAEKTLPQFKSSYDDEISELYRKIVNRREFRYDAASDPVYGSYRDRYVREGELAMRNTVGQTAALTGGYASTYSEAAGQQQYDAYLKKLNDVLPELYSDAYERYTEDGEALQDSFDLTMTAAKNEYDRYRDRVSDSKYVSEFASEQVNSAFEQRQKLYDNLYKLISQTGYQPSDEQLNEAGMTKEQAQALRKEYLRVNHLSEDGSGGAAYAGTAYEDIPKPKSVVDMLRERAEGDHRPQR